MKGQDDFYIPSSLSFSAMLWRAIAGLCFPIYGRFSRSASSWCLPEAFLVIFDER